MSVQSAKDFVAKVKGDKSIADSLGSAADDDARRKIAADAGFDFTKAEMSEALSAGGSKQLSDADLDTVAGGSSASWVSTGAAVGGAAAAAA
jgi:predicted ribosomally synthesized peptide with nif11-like leader